MTTDEAPTAQAGLSYGISTMLFSHDGPTTALTRIAEVGFRQVEIPWERPNLTPADWDAADVRRLLDRLGLTARVVHSPIGDADCGSLDEAKRRDSVARLAECFEPAARVGAEIVVVHANSPFIEYTADNWRASWVSSGRSIGELAEKAAAAGVKIAVENLPKHDGYRPGHSMAEIRRLVADLPEHVGLCLDTGHAACGGHDLLDELADAGQRLFHLHLHDNDGLEDRHWAPGRGVIDWPAFLAKLDEMAFSGPRILEVAAGENAPQDVLTKILQTARNWSQGNYATNRR